MLTQTTESEKKQIRKSYNLILLFAAMTSVLFAFALHDKSATLAGLTLFSFLTWAGHTFAYVIWDGGSTT